MKKAILLSFVGLITMGCGGAASTVSTEPAAEANQTNRREIQTVTAHTTEKEPVRPGATVVPKSDSKTKWTQSGNPIDTSTLDAEIEKAEKAYKAKPNDEAAKKALVEAYNKRGLALTEARQYASALGDYRRALKLDPGNEEARKWIKQIVSIYDSINRSYPAEGEEPPPLPFEKKS